MGIIQGVGSLSAPSRANYPEVASLGLTGQGATGIRGHGSIRGSQRRVERSRDAW